MLSHEGRWQRDLLRVNVAFGQAGRYFNIFICGLRLVNVCVRFVFWDSTFDFYSEDNLHLIRRFRYRRPFVILRIVFTFRFVLRLTEDRTRYRRCRRHVCVSSHVRFHRFS